MDKETFFKKLPVSVSDEQKKVILAADRATVVNASAGSGKTTTIIIKMLYQINVLDVEPNSILAITFSKNAQQDMEKRYRELAVNFEAQIAEPRFKTFHAFFLNLLTLNGTRYLICNPHKFYRKLRFCVKTKTTEMYDLLDELLQTYGSLVNNDITIDGIHDKDGNELDLKSITRSAPFSAADYKAVVSKYWQLKDEEGSIDFDDMQLILLAMLEDDSSGGPIREITQNAFSQCYIDEFQDVNPLQIHILNELFNYKGKNLWDHCCVIGDPNQAIYSFRGSDSSFITDFTKQHKNAQTFYLTTNYRCPDNILAPVLPLVGQKNKVKAFNDGGDITVLNENISLVDQVRKVKDSGSTAIIVRKHSSAVILVDQLARAGIKVKTKDHHERLMENDYFKDVMSLIKLADTHESNLLGHFVYRVFMVGHSKVSPDFNYTNILNREDAYDYFVTKNKGHVDPDIVLSLNEIRGSQDAITKIAIAMDLLDNYYQRSSNKKLINRIQSYILDCLVYNNQGNPISYDEFQAENMLLDRKLKKWSKDAEANDTEVSVLTCHAVKGLEFDNVFYIDVNDETLLNPALYMQMIKDKAYSAFETQFEEERHLFYVTWTRAKKHLFVQTSLDDYSLFFEELDKKLIPCTLQHWTALKYANQLKMRMKLGHAEKITSKEWYGQDKNDLKGDF